MTAPTPVNPDPRPASRPIPATDAEYWGAMDDNNVQTADGGIPWQELRDGATRKNLREAELLPVDVNGEAEQTTPGPQV